MNKITVARSIVFAFLILSLSSVRAVYSGSADLEAKKRKIYQDDSTESMRDVYIRREAENKEYKQKMLANSNETVKLLKDIKRLLVQLNAKEAK